MISAFLRPDTWDLCLDTSGNLAMCSEPYRLAQDTACACRLFQGELYWNTDAGAQNKQILNSVPASIPFCQAQYQKAALTVPGVTTAQAVLALGENRALTGQVQVNGMQVVNV